MFTLQRKLLVSFLRNYLSQKQKEYHKQKGWTQDVFSKLKKFVLKGKLIRGSLLLQSHLLFANNISQDAMKAAAALELMHSSILIHDDIIDNDSLRRGEKTIAKHYEEFGIENNIPNSNYFGKNMGICVGDIGFFLGFALLCSMKNENAKNVLEYFTKEFASVGFAQMQDIFALRKKTDSEENAILDLYKNKTGRYTFSLPLVAGAMLANQPSGITSVLEKLGEVLGILFQLKDDELDIFGNQKTIGKPIGSDIKENKKTLLRFHLYSEASQNDKKKLNAIFGNKNISLKEIQYVGVLMKSLGVDKKIAHVVNTYKQEANAFINALDLGKKQKEIFLQLLAYNLKRNK